MTQTVFIDGAAGTTGLEIAERLAGRSEFSLIALPDAERKDAARRAEALNGADFVILCLPDAAAIEAVAMVTNPGCYPTGFLALVAPLVVAGIVDRSARLSVNAVSGYSGGGKELIARFEADEDIGFRSYGLNLAHKHVPEMTKGAGLVHAPIFAPAVVPVYRGMLVEVPLGFDTPNADAVFDALAAHFEESALVSVSRAGNESELLLRKSDEATDRMELMLYAGPDGTQLRLVARLDNLGKGASGACVQNLNILAGLPETTGLRL